MSANGFTDSREIHFSKGWFCCCGSWPASSSLAYVLYQRQIPQKAHESLRYLEVNLQRNIKNLITSQCSVKINVRFDFTEAKPNKLHLFIFLKRYRQSFGFKSASTAFISASDSILKYKIKIRIQNVDLDLKSNTNGNFK